MRRYFENYVSSLFHQNENKSIEGYFIGVLSEGSSSNDVFNSKFKYQIECTMKINKGYLDNQGIYIECNANLKTEI